MLMTLFQAVEYFQRVLAIEEENGEVWSSLGVCPYWLSLVVAVLRHFQGTAT